MTRKQISDERWAAALARADEGDLSELAQGVLRSCSRSRLGARKITTAHRSQNYQTKIEGCWDGHLRIYWTNMTEASFELTLKKDERTRSVLPRIYRVTDEALENLVNRKGRDYDERLRPFVQRAAVSHS